MSETWTDERVETLKKRWGEGLSASRVAAILGGDITRQAVINKVHRLNLQRGAQTTRETISQTSKMRAKASAPQPERVVPIRPTKAADRPGKLLVELGSFECRWPLDDPGAGNMEQARFCAAPGAPLLGTGAPYCEHHRRRALPSRRVAS